MAYETQPGTIPHRAVEHLKTLPEGTALPTAELAAALDVEPTVFVQCMAAPRKHGLVAARQSEGRGRALLWSLGDGAAFEEAADADLTEEPDVPRFCLWDDGDLQVWGIEANEDGSFTIPLETLGRIKARIAWSPIVA